MYTKPMILPLDSASRIYALQDEKGNTIGTGTLEVCEVLMSLITKPASPSDSGRIRSLIPETRIIVLTAYGSAEMEDEARRNGADAFLRKPKPLYPRLPRWSKA